MQPVPSTFANKNKDLWLKWRKTCIHAHQNYQLITPEVRVSWEGRLLNLCFWGPVFDSCLFFLLCRYSKHIFQNESLNDVKHFPQNAMFYMLLHHLFSAPSRVGIRPISAWESAWRLRAPRSWAWRGNPENAGPSKRRFRTWKPPFLRATLVSGRVTIGDTPFSESDLRFLVYS